MPRHLAKVQDLQNLLNSINEYLAGSDPNPLVQLRFVQRLQCVLQILITNQETYLPTRTINMRLLRLGDSHGILEEDDYENFCNICANLQHGSLRCFCSEGQLFFVKSVLDRTRLRPDDVVNIAHQS